MMPGPRRSDLRPGGPNARMGAAADEAKPSDPGEPRPALERQEGEPFMHQV